MGSDAMQAQVAEVVGTIFNVPADTVNLESSPTTIENWDSMGHLMLVLELEQRFGLQLAPEEVETLTSVGSIVDLLERKATA